jgi:hypothetical protein
MPGALPPPSTPNAAPLGALPPPADTSLMVPPKVGGALDAVPTLPRGPDSGFTFPNTQGVTDVSTRAPNLVNLQALSKRVKSVDQIGAVGDGASGQVLKQAGSIAAAKEASGMLEGLVPAFRRAMDAHRAHSPAVNVARDLVDNGGFPSRIPEDPRMAGFMESLGQVNQPAMLTVQGKLMAADRLNQLGVGNSSKGLTPELNQSTLGKLAAPLGNLGGQSNSEDIARLLATVSPQNRAILEALSKRDPRVFEQSRLAGQLGGLGVSEQGDK